jgi:hypothetical protein
MQYVFDIASPVRLCKSFSVLWKTKSGQIQQSRCLFIIRRGLANVTGKQAWVLAPLLPIVFHFLNWPKKIFHIDTKKINMADFFFLPFAGKAELADESGSEPVHRRISNLADQ